MGYYWPPAPSTFTPAPRPMTWEGKWLTPQLFVHVAKDEDLNFFDNPLAWGGFGVRSHGGGGISGKTPAELADLYNRMTWIVAPGDPPTGGLPADRIEGSNLIMEYFDLSDFHNPKRKSVTYVPRKDGMDMHVIEWDPQKNDWFGEGFDAEREFTLGLPDIMRGLQIATSLLIGILTGNPILAQAWSSAMQMGVGAALGQPPPSPAQAFATLIQTPGAAVDLGSILSKTGWSDSIMRSFNGALGQWPDPDLLSKLTNVAKQYAGALPKIDFPAVIVGKLPALRAPGDLSANAIGAASQEMNKALAAAAAAFKSGDANKIYSIRKTVVDQPTFDLSFAAIKAAKVTSEATTTPTETTSTGVTERSRSLGTLMVYAGVTGLLGAAALRFTPQKYQRSARIPHVTNSSLLVGAGISFALTIAGLFIRSRSTSGATNLPPPQRDLVTTSTDKSATAHIRQF